MSNVLKSHWLTWLFLIGLMLLIQFSFFHKEILSSFIFGNLNLSLLIKLAPDMIKEFVYGRGLLFSLHYLIISVLIATYVVLLVYIFRTKRLMTFKSGLVSLAGFLGVSIGLSCLSCGAIFAYLFIGVVGSAAIPYLIVLNSDWVLWLGESLLLVSILLVLRKL